MRKEILVTFLSCIIAVGAQAQKFALIDMEYILENIPAYEQVLQQLDEESDKYQAEVDALQKESEALYKAYQESLSQLSAVQRTEKEEAIIAKEKQAAELRQKYFGPQGVMIEMQNQLLAPIHDQIYEAVKTISMQQGYTLVIDRSSAASVIFASPTIDISNVVLSTLGYIN